jgi:NAD(P)-dependent dehydrogenase (short-subunit alcohol dehydrogenase family)
VTAAAAGVDLSDRVAIVTGAGQGIGREHARRLAAAGAAVVVQDRNDPAALVDELRAAGSRAVAAVGDIADWSFAHHVVDVAVETFGGLDVLVNNAGIVSRALLGEMTEAQFDEVVQVNLKGTFGPTQAALAYWRANGAGQPGFDASVISTASGAGLLGNPGQTHYGATKAGVAAMTAIAALELEGTGIRLNAIAPAARTPMSGEGGTSGVATFMAAPDDPDVFDRFHPRNIAPLVAYLASRDCSLTGQVFSVRGGTIAHFRGWTLSDGLEVEGPWTEAEIGARLPQLVAEAPDRRQAGGPVYEALRAAQSADNLPTK